MPAMVKIVGLNRLLQKLEASHLTAPAVRGLVRAAGESGQTFLGPIIPRETGASAGTMALSIRDAGELRDIGARLSVTAFPLRFHEFGTKHIKRRRFMAKTISKMRRTLKDLIGRAVAQVESTWAA